MCQSAGTHGCCRLLCAAPPGHGAQGDRAVSLPPAKCCAEVTVPMPPLPRCPQRCHVPLAATRPPMAVVHVLPCAVCCSCSLLPGALHCTLWTPYSTVILQGSQHLVAMYLGRSRQEDATWPRGHRGHLSPAPAAQPWQGACRGDVCGGVGTDTDAHVEPVTVGTLTLLSVSLQGFPQRRSHWPPPSNGQRLGRAARHPRAPPPDPAPQPHGEDGALTAGAHGPGGDGGGHGMGRPSAALSASALPPP